MYSLVIGFAVSFLGQLPIGFINLLAVQITVQDNVKKAMQYVAGVALVEMIYLRCILSFLDTFLKNKNWIYIIEILTIAVFTILGVLNFRKFLKTNNPSESQIIIKKQNRLIQGVLISILNFAQIPFWIVWSSYIITQKIILPTSLHYNYFTVGTGFGTAAGMCIYILIGKKWVAQIRKKEKPLQLLISILFFISAGLIFYKLLCN